MSLTQEEIKRIALEQSAIDAGCTPADFLRSENVIVPSVVSPDARRYLKQPLECTLISYGANVVVTAQDAYRAIAADYVGRFSPAECFETPAMLLLDDALRAVGLRICFQAEYFLPELSAMQVTDCPYELRLLHPVDFAPLYTSDWSNALCIERAALDTLGIGAYDDGRLVGFAACSADCRDMWQIGVDVLPAYRGQGISTAVTSRLAAEILAAGKVPFYCAAWSNIRSVRNALRCGFRPAWVELSAKPIDYIRDQLED